jgi:hypothetical protein
MSAHPCRFCSRPLEHVFVDLGESPLSNAFVDPSEEIDREPVFPLTVYVCDRCFLVQLPEHESADAIFSDDYVYFSSFSDSWLEHCRRYVEEMIRRFDLGPESQVIELASNDGYLLQYFAGRGVPVLGIEPAANVAAAAREKGIPTMVRFFGRDAAEELLARGTRADLLLGNNVLAHVPDLHDFVGGMKIALDQNGVITMEFPHLLRLIEENQFDTIYHEHYSYLSFGTVREIFAAHQLSMFDVEEIPTHGGSLRIFAQHDEERRQVSHRVPALLAREEAAGLRSLATYLDFGDSVRRTRRDLLEFLAAAKAEGRAIAAYGAASKGNTLLNYCGVGPESVEYVVDRNPAKQGKLLPGSRIPVHPPERIFETRPDYILILPWNIKEEILEQMAAVREWGARFVVAIPRVEVLDPMPETRRA